MTADAAGWTRLAIIGAIALFLALMLEHLLEGIASPLILLFGALRVVIVHMRVPAERRLAGMSRAAVIAMSREELRRESAGDARFRKPQDPWW